RHAPGDLAEGGCARAACGEDYIRRERDQFHCVLADALSITGAPSVVDAQIASDGPTRFLQPLVECCQAGLPLRIIRRKVHEDASAAHSLALLRAPGERPCSSRTTQKLDEC